MSSHIPHPQPLAATTQYLERNSFLTDHCISCEYYKLSLFFFFLSLSGKEMCQMSFLGASVIPWAFSFHSAQAAMLKLPIYGSVSAALPLQCDLLGNCVVSGFLFYPWLPVLLDTLSRQTRNLSITLRFQRKIVPEVWQDFCVTDSYIKSGHPVVEKE